MSAICGLVRLEGSVEPGDREVVERMLAAIAHRGDGETHVVVDDGAVLGGRSNKRIGGDRRQPHRDPHAPLTLLVDGSILNARSLAEALGVAEERADVDILAALYARDADGCVDFLRGDFAIAIWDADQRRLLLARDRQGVKPLYWASARGVLLFASELKGVLASKLVGSSINLRAIDSLLTFGFVAGPITALDGISKLSLGERLIAARGRVTVDRFWSYPAPAPDRMMNEDALARRLAHELEEAVKARIGEHPSVGVMLSGGLDSSVVAAIARRAEPAELHTFSAGFGGLDEANELAEARAFAQQIDAIHHEIELSLMDDAFDLEELVWRLDEPVAELSTVGIVGLSEVAAGFVPFALSGQGADGILGGLPEHRTAAIVARLDVLPTSTKRLLRRAFAHRTGRIQRGSRVLAAQGAVDRFLAACGGVSAETDQALLRPALAKIVGTSARSAVVDRLGSVQGDPLSTFIFLDEQLAAVESVLHYNDRAATAGPIDVRFPFLDHHVVEFAATIPTNLKVHRLTRKYLLRRVARDLVPEEIITRPKRGFFNAAIGTWLQRQMPGAIDRYFFETEPRCSEFLELGPLRTLFTRHLSGEDTTRSGLVLTLLVLEVWLASYLPRATA
jgi:asparagine synthase (glutamine-hydrolysing)